MEYLTPAGDVTMAEQTRGAPSGVRSLQFVVKALKYAWALPNTAVGMLLVPAALDRRSGMRVIDGALEIHGPAIAWILRNLVPLPGGAAAITFGHIVTGRDRESLDLTRAHERVHVRQCEVWGPAFIPAYLLAGAWQWIRGGDAYEDNYFERQARECDLQITRTSSRLPGADAYRRRSRMGPRNGPSGSSGCPR